MDRYDPALETGLEASMWRLGLRGGGGGELYPERLDEPDCVYYLRTGVCGYGSRCRFNHPRNRSPVLGGLRTEAGEFPERMGQPVCQVSVWIVVGCGLSNAVMLLKCRQFSLFMLLFSAQHFMRTGTCRFGATCKYHHPRQGGRDSVTALTSLSYMGLPLRPGEKECSYYMRTGQCKFGSTCRFHHPVPPGVQAPSLQLSTGSAIYPPLHSQSVPSPQQFGVAIPRPQLLQGSYVQSPYGTYNQMVLPPPGMVPYSGWNPYQASSISAMPSHGSQPSMGSSSVYGIRPSSPPAPAYPPGSSSNKEQTFPQRPGQPECQYFMRTGDCKFGNSCRFHHPLEAASPKGVNLSPIGLPIRPGTAQCSHFAQHGVCKFGPACKFDHSMSSSSLSYSPSASSVSDMHVVPYPLGSSSLGISAPSSSSSLSDQRTELHSSSSIKPTNTTSGGSETLPAETRTGDSASIEVKTSS
ncbi:hypothetical protein IGI04_004985 [Brassica rapa subsp. trilocularis]|uniref:C3H1-type domain-containing protein n=1 Tax=Brassica rapa subsp. trilocularis TaxID=1813537 RepID=A0ABQ7NES3_BRACM|nr:hypothetical protein IGI04_004985 [Brassica rapa subsp. trilocularis]